ncbi:unnamed protein product [Toxocara canis]|nr:unnamed protein product [Toxocara canis]
MLAPFVAHEDMMQLTTDIHGLLPDFNFADWIPADPAPLHASNAEQRRPCQTSGSSPALSPAVSSAAHTPQNSLNGCVSSSTTLRKSSTPVSRHNSGSRSFRPVPYQTPSTSPGPKPTTAAHYSFSNGGISAGTIPKRVETAAELVSRTVSDTDVASPEWIHRQEQQLHHRSQSMQTNVLAGGCTWTEIGTRTYIHAAVQQQRV